MRAVLAALPKPVLRGMIYAVGGFSGPGVVSSVKRYDGEGLVYLTWVDDPRLAFDVMGE